MPALTLTAALGRLALVALLAVVAACSLFPATPQAPNGALVTYRAHGGLCLEGECEFSAQIFADGRVVRSDGMPQVVDPMSLGLLTRGIEAADWDAILAVPFAGECPVAFDGQEETYTFHVPPEPVVIASCTTAVDRSRSRSRRCSGSCSERAAEGPAAENRLSAGVTFHPRGVACAGDPRRQRP